LEAFNLLPNGDARCGSKPVRWRCRSIYTKGEHTPRDSRRASLLSQSHNLTSDRNPMGPLDDMDGLSTAQKAHANKIDEKPVSVSNTCERWLASRHAEYDGDFRVQTLLGACISARSIGFCAIWVCIGPSSSSVHSHLITSRALLQLTTQIPVW
jgi:hypothetical protein